MKNIVWLINIREKSSSLCSAFLFFNDDTLSEKNSYILINTVCSVTLPTSATEQGFSKYNQGVRGVSPGRHAKFKDNEQVCVHKVKNSNSPHCECNNLSTKFGGFV